MNEVGLSVTKKPKSAGIASKRSGQTMTFTNISAHLHMSISVLHVAYDLGEELEEASRRLLFVVT